MDKSLGYNIPVFSFAIPALVLMDVSFYSLQEFYHNKPIKVPKTEVILHASKCDMYLLKKHYDWTPLSSIFLPPFVVEADVLYGQAYEAELFNVFRYDTTAFGGGFYGDTDSDENLDCNYNNDNNKLSSGTKSATVSDQYKITVNFNEILDFL